MIDGGKVVAQVGDIKVCLYEAMRVLALQFAAGGMTIDNFLDGLERLSDDAVRKEVTDGNTCNW